MSHLFGNYARKVTITGGYTPVFPKGKPIQQISYNNPFPVATTITGSGPFDAEEGDTADQKYVTTLPANSSVLDHEPFYPRSTVFFAATSGTTVSYRYGAGAGDQLTPVF